LLELDWLTRAGIEVAILRLDQIDPLISGNKWFKLVEHLKAADRAGAQGVISLGGAHSNHLHALAAAGKRLGFETVGLLRGHPQQTPTVSDCRRSACSCTGSVSAAIGRGMSRGSGAVAGAVSRFSPGAGGRWRIGGRIGLHGVEGAGDRATGQPGWSDYDGWWLACGTGTTLAGLVLAEAGDHPVYGALAVPDDHGVAPQVADYAGAGVAAADYELLDASRGGLPGRSAVA
jgi:1-aminocyclopropane-1-carboxylate deaminase